MTPEEEMHFWAVYQSYMKQREMRKGQALMNALRSFPILYDMISQTFADCFYQDSKIPAFCIELGIEHSAMNLGIIEIPSDVRYTWS